MKSLLIALILFVSNVAHTQELKDEYWLASDSSACIYPGNIARMDSSVCYMKPFSVVEWSLPYRITNESAVHIGREGQSATDSIGIVASLPNGYDFLVCTGQVHREMWKIATLHGPLAYGIYWVAFNTYPTSIQPDGAKYVMLQCVATDRAKGEAPIQVTGSYAAVDAALFKSPQSLRVPVSPDSSHVPTEFIDVLGRPCLPSNVYKVLPDGRALVP